MYVNNACLANVKTMLPRGDVYWDVREMNIFSSR